MDVHGRTAPGRLGELVRRHRRSAGLSQRELAERSGVSERSIRDLERGVRSPRPHSVRAVGVALELDNENLTALLAAAQTNGEPAAGHTLHAAHPFPGTLHGRDAEMRQLLDLVLGRRHRLITVCGPAGVGKSRLAAELVTELRRLNEPVHVLDLSAVDRSNLVLEAIAAATGCGSSRLAPADRIAAHLRQGRTVLVVDRFEQVLAAGAELVTLLHRCAGLSIVLTSQRPVRVRGERLVRLGPLPPAAAMALFTERAAATCPGFAVTPDTADAVQLICRRVDHLPLAIELAAARMRLMHPAELAGRLARRLPVLGDGALDLPPRHRSLRAAIESSLAVVTDDSRRLFAWLGLFPAGAPLDDLEPVADSLGMPHDALLSAVGELADISLVRVALAATGTRYVLPDAMAELAAERRAADPQATARAAGAVADHYLTRVRYTTGGDGKPMTGDDTAGVRAALGWYAEHRPAAVTWGLVNAVARFYEATGRLADGEDLMNRVAAAGHAPAWVAAGQLAAMRGDMSAATRAATRALEDPRLGDPVARVSARMVLGRVHSEFGDAPAARTELRRSLREAKRAGDIGLTARVLNNLAAVSTELGRPRDAERQLRAALAAKERSGASPIERGRTLFNLGETALEDGRYAEAHQRAVRAREVLAGELHQLAAMAATTEAVALLHLGRTADALAASRRALTLIGPVERHDRIRMIVELRCSVAEHAAGELTVAGLRLAETLRRAFDSAPAAVRPTPRDGYEVAQALRLHAGLLVDRDPEGAAGLLGAAGRMSDRALSEATHRHVQQVTAAWRAAGRFEAAYAAGGRMTGEQLVRWCDRVAARRPQRTAGSRLSRP